MKYSMDDWIKKAMKKEMHPAKRLEEETIMRMREKKEGSAMHVSRSRRFRPAYTVLAVVLIFVFGTTVCARALGFSFKDVFFNWEGQPVESEEVKDYDMNFTIIQEYNTFKDAKVTLQQLVVDGSSAYAVLKVESEKLDSYIENADSSKGNLTLTLGSHEFRYDDETAYGGHVVTGDFQCVGSEENTRYYVVSMSGLSMDLEKCNIFRLRFEDLVITGDELETEILCEEGVYKIGVSLDQIPDTKSLVVEDDTLEMSGKQGTVKIEVTPFALYVKSDFPGMEQLEDFEKYEEFWGYEAGETGLNYVVLKDGSKVEGFNLGASFIKNVQDMTILFENIVNPADIESIHIGDKVFTP